jgi:hypothetical protein
MRRDEKLRRNVPLLGKLGIVERLLRALEIGAAALPIGVEEQRLKSALLSPRRNCYFNKFGQLIYSEKRGIPAGYKWPQAIKDWIGLSVLDNYSSFFVVRDVGVVIASTIEGSSFSGLSTRVEIGHMHQLRRKRPHQVARVGLFAKPARVVGWR